MVLVYADFTSITECISVTGIKYETKEAFSMKISSDTLHKSLL
jgi:hypothetical protein